LKEEVASLLKIQVLLLVSRLSEITKEHFHLQGKQIILTLKERLAFCSTFYLS
jgi:hypothetical protein